MFLWLKANKYLALGFAGIILIVVVIAFFNLIDKGNQREERNLRNQGAVVERSQQQGETLNAVRNAQQPVSHDELNVVCSKYDRNCPANH